jgi:hypothetical protein
LNDSVWPAAVAERLIGQLAPVVSEIAARSGAPGELVLRRDVGGGRREEVYVTKAELCEKVMVLPPSRRAAFERLGLHDLRGVAPPAPPPRDPALPRQSVIHVQGAEAALTPGAAE